MSNLGSAHTNNPKIHSLLTPDNCSLIMIDFQPQMAFAVKSIDGQTLINNAVGLAKSAKVFDIPTILTTVAERNFSGPMFSQISAIFPAQHTIDRTTMNCWEDKRVVDAFKKTERNKLVLAGLWTEVCIVLPAIQALEAGYEVYVIADACGGTSYTAHDMAMLRLIQAGAVPMTWLQFLLELQRDWARSETYEAVTKIVREDAGTYGLGVEYARAMLGEHAREGIEESEVESEGEEDFVKEDKEQGGL
jgi:nicotinamidase-related amidase